MKVKKDDIATFEKLQADFQAKLGELQQAVADYNADVEAAFGELKNAQIDFDEAREALQEHMQNIAQSLQEAHDDKSEKWQESEAAEKVTTMISDWKEKAEAYSAEPDIPEPIQIDDPADQYPAEGDEMPGYDSANY